MSLPSTYTKLDYIESHGTEYFDTGFKANQDTRVVIDFDATGAAGTAWLFGGRSAISNLSFSVVYLGTWRSDYDSVDGIMSSVNPTGRFTLDKDKNITKFNGVVGVTDTYKAFQCVYNLYLLANNTAGTANAPIKCKLYSCKIYNNGTLIRDFIPAMNASGTIGLWDDVNSTFYTNAGTGTLTTGKKHKTLIGGTGYEVKGGRVLIGGTGYSIKKGRTLIGGTGYDISFGTSIGELEEGTLVKLSELGSPVEFYIAKHDYESGLNGAGRTLLVRKELEGVRKWDSNKSTETRYAVCTLDSWFNGEYKERFASFVQVAMGTTKFYYTISGDNKTVTTLERSIFTPSAYEMFGATQANDNYSACNVEGSVLPIASILRAVLYDDGYPRQWSRSVNVYGNTNAQVLTIGYTKMKGQNAGTTNSTNCPRPCFTLPASMKIDDDFNIIQS